MKQALSAEIDTSGGLIWDLCGWIFLLMPIFVIVLSSSSYAIYHLLADSETFMPKQPNICWYEGLIVPSSFQPCLCAYVARLTCGEAAATGKGSTMNKSLNLWLSVRSGGGMCWGAKWGSSFQGSRRFTHTTFLKHLMSCFDYSFLSALCMSREEWRRGKQVWHSSDQVLGSSKILRYE